MKKKNGFTLIELLAVIIILGILMIIAIPSVTRYISDSRKSAYVDTAKEIIGSARNIVNSGQFEMYDTDVTYYIESSCIKTENASKSPYGEFTKAYVVVTYDGKGYNYYWTSVDDAGQGIKNIVRIDKLDTNNVESDLKDSEISTLRGIDGRSKTVVVSKQNNCQKEGANNAEIPIDGETGEEVSSGGNEDISTDNKICRRATLLHTEECKRTSGGCYDVGYYPEGSKGTATITYGNLGTSGSLPVAGDAFDCDVNDDGFYDSSSERFYFITKYINADNKDVAVLILFSNVHFEIADAGNNGVEFATQSSILNMGEECTQSQGCNNYGPVDAFSHLPSITRWKNNQLLFISNPNLRLRQIVAENGSTSTTGGIIKKFTYVNKSARFLTYQEVQAACGNDVTSIGDLDNCNYLLERLLFDKSSGGKGYFWLETPRSDSPSSGWDINGSKRNVYRNNSNYNNNLGVRPVIDVLISNIDY